MGWKDTIVTNKKSWKDTISETDVVSPKMAKAIFPEPQEQEVPLTQTIAETAGDVLVTAPQGVTTFADEIQAGMQAGFKKAMGNKDPYMDLYEKEVAPIRQDIANARDRSPIATTVGEIGTGISTSMIPGIGAGKLGSLKGALARGAVEGLGASEDKAGVDGMVSTAMGAGLGGASHLASSGIKKFITMDTNKTRAGVLGAGATQLKETGVKDRATIAKNLKEAGLFHPTKVDYDVASGKFKPVAKSLDNLDKPGKEKYLSRLENASEKIQLEKEKLLAQMGSVPVDIDGVEAQLLLEAKKFAGKGTGYKERLAEATRLKQQIIDDIVEHMDETSPSTTLSDLESAKMRLKADVGKYGRDPLLAKTPDTQELFQTYYRAINKEIRNLMGDNKYAKYNDIQQNMLTAEADLINSIAADQGRSRSGALPRNYLQRSLDATIMSDDTKLGVANVRDFMDNTVGNSALKNVVRPATEELGYGVLRQMDSSMPEAQPSQDGKGYDFSNSSQAFPWNKSPQDQVKALPGRMPQSLPSPREMVSYRIPRTTQGILESKDLVLAKLIQNGVPSDMIDTIDHALNEDPESVSNIVPLILEKFPAIFERSKYQVFDGIIAGPDRPKAADAISKREDLNSIQRAKAIDGINKSGKMPEELK